MKVRCHREGMLSAFQLVTAALPSRDIKPILQNVKASCRDSTCNLLATDLELGIRLELRGPTIEEPGEALLPGDRVLAILREATDNELTFEVSGQLCRVYGLSNEFEMGAEEPSEFPEIPSFEETAYHEMAAEVLREMIRRTIFAVAVENPRYALTGVLWEVEGDSIRLVATDGRRLAVTDGKGVAHGGHSTKGQTCVVPTKAMQILERNLQDGDAQVRVALRPNEALFKTDRATIYSRLVEGRYPPYQEVFPKKQTVKVPLTVGAFHGAVRQAAIMTDAETKKVFFNFEKKKLTLQAQGANTGRSRVELPIEYDGKTIKVAFDPKYVCDMMRVLDGKDVLTLELVDGNSVGLFRHGPSYSYIVMPLT